MLGAFLKQDGTPPGAREEPPKDENQLNMARGKQELNFRKTYANNFLMIAKIWLFLVIIILSINMIWNCKNRLPPTSNSVLIVLIGTSLGVVLGPASLIGGNLFKGKD